MLGAALTFIDTSQIEQQVGALADRFGFEPSRTDHCGNSRWGAAASRDSESAWRDARVLILDEPTAVLTPQEAVELGEVLRRMEDGRSVIFISHKLDEVVSCDEATVQCGGETVAASIRR